MRFQTLNQLCLNSIDGQGATVDAPARASAQVLVVIAQMPDQVARLLVADAEVVRDAGDSAQRVVGFRAGCVDLADDRVLGSCNVGQHRHRRADPVAALAETDGV
jgi:hypothetical protein